MSDMVALPSLSHKLTSVACSTGELVSKSDFAALMNHKFMKLQLNFNTNQNIKEDLITHSFLYT